MADDEEQIRTLIERWAEAAHSGDMSGVLADHSDDMVVLGKKHRGAAVGRTPVQYSSRPVSPGCRIERLPT